MEAEVEITLTYSSEGEAEAISKAVSPDNLGAPRELTVKTKAIGNSVTTVIKYCGENIATLMSTIDDLLSCISTAEKIILSIRKVTAKHA
jgi:tRNA threonylcarbamoyladenosine modification (KEOPS) complex  Pcc1 subunit